MDSPINADIIGFASDIALAINVIGTVAFALVMRRLWVTRQTRPPAESATIRRRIAGAH